MKRKSTSLMKWACLLTGLAFTVSCQLTEDVNKDEISKKSKAKQPQTQSFSSSSCPSPTLSQYLNVNGGVGGISINPVTNKMYFTNGVTSTGYVITVDLNTNMITDSVPSQVSPQGIAVNPVTNRIYSTNVNSSSVTVLDGASNTILTTISLPYRPRLIAVNPATNKIYVSNVDQRTNFAVIDGNTNTISGFINTVVRYADNVAVNPMTNRVYAAMGVDNTVKVFDGATNGLIATIPVGNFPDGLGINTVTNRIYVTNIFSQNVTVIDGNTNTAIATIPVGTEPRQAVVDEDKNLIYVSNKGSNTVTIIDGTSNSVINTINVNPFPEPLAVDPNTGRLYIGSIQGSFGISVLVNNICTNILPDSISLKGNGVLPVVIYSSSIANGDNVDFDATEVDPSTVVFGPDKASPQGKANLIDLNGDGLRDLQLRFKKDQTGIQCGDTQATIMGNTFDGVPFEGYDTFTTVNCD